MTHFIFLIIFSLQRIKGAFYVEPSSKSPKLIPLNKSYALVEYKDSFVIEDFTAIQKVVFLGDEIDMGEEIKFAIASEKYSHEKVNADGTYLQPLIEGKNIIAKIDLCTGYKHLHIEITEYRVTEPESSTYFKNIVNFQNMSDIDKENLICLNDKRKVVLSLGYSEDVQVQNCITKIDLCNKDDDPSCQSLSEGENDLGPLKESKPLIIRINDSFKKDIELIACNEQNARRILRNTADWICTIENKTVNFFKREWEDFQIEKVYFGETVQIIHFGYNNTFEHIPRESNLIVKYISKDKNDTMNRLQLMTNMTPCPSYIRNEKWLELDKTHIIIISTTAAILFAMILLIIVCVIKRNAAKKSTTTVDVNPTYGDVEEYDGYYMDTKVTDNNEDYNKSEYNEDGEYIGSEMKDTNQYYSN